MGGGRGGGGGGRRRGGERGGGGGYSMNHGAAVRLGGFTLLQHRSEFFTAVLEGVAFFCFLLERVAEVDDEGVIVPAFLLQELQTPWEILAWEKTTSWEEGGGASLLQLCWRRGRDTADELEVPGWDTGGGWTWSWTEFLPSRMAFRLDFYLTPARKKKSFAPCALSRHPPRRPETQRKLYSYGTSEWGNGTT